MRALLLMLTVSGPFLLVAAPIYLVVKIRFHSRSVLAAGTVLGSEAEEADKAGSPAAYRLTVRYETADGQRHTVTKKGTRRYLAEGTAVQVRYDPDRPHRASLRHDTRHYKEMAALMFVGGVVGCAALAGFLANW